MNSNNKASNATARNASADTAYAVHFEALLEMAEEVARADWMKEGLVEGKTKADWNEVGSLGEARKKMAEAMYHLGILSAAQVKEKHDLTL